MSKYEKITKLLSREVEDAYQAEEYEVCGALQESVKLWEAYSLLWEYNEARLNLVKDLTEICKQTNSDKTIGYKQAARLILCTP